MNTMYRVDHSLYIYFAYVHLLSRSPLLIRNHTQNLLNPIPAAPPQYVLYIWGWPHNNWPDRRPIL